MKSDIHPQYFEASISCACGNKWKTGATVEKIDLEICNKCHPFYTGKIKFVDKRGRLEKIEKRLKLTRELAATAKTKKIADAKKATALKKKELKKAAI